MQMARADLTDKVRICMAVTPDGLTAYCNKKALIELSKQLSMLAESDAKDHYETHVRMQFQDDESLFDGKKPDNIWVLRTKPLAPMLAPHGDQYQQDFELTFMVTPEAELDDLTIFQGNGLLPDDWNAIDFEPV